MKDVLLFTSWHFQPFQLSMQVPLTEPQCEYLYVLFVHCLWQPLSVNVLLLIAICYFILSHQWEKVAVLFYDQKPEQGGTTEDRHICRKTQKSSGVGGVFEEAVKLLICLCENICFILLQIKVVSFVWTFFYFTVHILKICVWSYFTSHVNCILNPKFFI